MYKYNLKERYERLHDGEKKELRAKIRATGYSDGTMYHWFKIKADERRTIPGGAQTGTLAHYLLQRSEAPRLTYKLKGCPGKSSRRCGDLVTINDTAIMSAARTAFITAINWRLTENGFRQDLECLDATSLYPYQSTGYFVLGTNKLGASGSLTAPIFY
jgi:hypothetical protein